MDEVQNCGGDLLHGEVLVSGSKNVAFLELCATLLAAEPRPLQDVSRLQDVFTMNKLIRIRGVRAEQDHDGSVRVDVSTSSAPETPSAPVKTRRTHCRVVIAGLIANGKTVLDRINHLDRGCGQMQARLRDTGADLEQFK